MVLATPLLMLGLPATAQTQLTCDEISFGADLTSRYPDIYDACQSVVEIDGERYAKMTVELIRTRGNQARFRFKERDGDFGPAHSVTLDPSWRANIQGREYRLRDLSPGQELSIYLPGDRWEAHVAQTDMPTITVWYGVVMIQEDFSAEPELPMTSSEIPLLGLLGGGALFTAFLLRVFRRRYN
jgi:hypothetical protein